MNDSINVYAAKHRTEQTRVNCTSGGAFLALAKYITDLKGYVFGVKFDENFRSVFDYTNSFEECTQFVGSKYAQAEVGNSFIKIKELLSQGNYVLFVGTPCQVYGLKCFLGKVGENEKLFCVDLICMGVGSPMVWKNYLDDVFKDEEIKKIFLKNKQYGWHKFSVCIDTDKRTYLKVGGKDLFMSAYVSGLMMRPSCYTCSFKGTQRKADMTIGDFWGVENYMPEIDDNKGISLLISYTKQGEKLVEAMNNEMEMYSLKYEEAISGNRYFSIYKEYTSERDKYMSMQKKNPSKCFRKYNPESFVFRVKKKLKK